MHTFHDWRAEEVLRERWIEVLSPIYLPISPYISGQVGGSTPLDAASVNACMRRNEGGLGLGLGLGLCLGLGLRPNPVPKPIPNSIPNPNTPGVGRDLLTYPGP